MTWLASPPRPTPCSAVTDGQLPTVVIDESVTIVDGPSVDGPVIRHPAPAETAGGLAAEIRGVLELTGTCLYVQSDEVGERYPVVWPAGTRWDVERATVMLPGGRSLTMGAQLVGAGGVFFAADIAGIAGSDAQQVAARCVDNRYGEIAALNNSNDAIYSS